jgi:SAM-dependent methyltransferase
MAAPLPWHETFFSGLAVESLFVLAALAKTDEEARFVETACGSVAGKKLLDVPCGEGRLSRALAARGAEVTGIDRTATLVEAARSAAAEKNLACQFLQRDMRDLPWTGVFDGAVCVGNSFGYFDDAGNQAFVAAVRRVLAPGGTIVLETCFAAEVVLPMTLGKRWYELGELCCLHDSRYDPATSNLTSDYAFMKNGHVEEKKQAHYRVYLCREIVALLRQAGFDSVECFGSTAREPFRAGSDNLWIEAR